MAERPPIPPPVLANWRAWRLGDVDALADDVRARCAAATGDWSLRELEPLAGGEVAVVLAGRATGLGEIVLKLTPRPVGEPPSREGEALALWAAEGIAPRVHRIADDGMTLLLERVRPGMSLRDTGADAREVVETIGGLCRRLHRPAADRFESLEAHARRDGWFEALAGTREHDELRGLTAPGPDDRLLHLDLHHLNVLRAAVGWRVIDPKPCLGDPCADVWAFLDGRPLGDLPTVPAATRPWVRGLVAAYARASALDEDRLATWIRLRACVRLGGADRGGPRRDDFSRLVEALD